ncbi:MAG: SulP family inorganic anion transporter [Actinobacteria bacterium]|nr:SulP family inorganic anion transporter [Actinomycetota bacterium]
MRGFGWVRRRSTRDDAVAGLVLGVQSVPDGLATGLLAGVNPLAGLYAYLVGSIAGALVTSSVFMVVQGTGAMAMVISDVDAVHDSTDPARALFTLSILTGVVMLAGGLLRLGVVLRFVSSAVMVGFINAVGVNIVLGQLSNLTGYTSDGANRVTRAIDTVLSPSELHWQSVAVGVATIVLILVLERTPLRSLGLVVAVIVTSARLAARLIFCVRACSESSAAIEPQADQPGVTRYGKGEVIVPQSDVRSDRPAEVARTGSAEVFHSYVRRYCRSVEY